MEIQKKTSIDHWRHEILSNPNPILKSNEFWSETIIWGEKQNFVVIFFHTNIVVEDLIRINSFSFRKICQIGHDLTRRKLTRPNVRKTGVFDDENTDNLHLFDGTRWFEGFYLCTFPFFFLIWREEKKKRQKMNFVFVDQRRINTRMCLSIGQKEFLIIFIDKFIRKLEMIDWRRRLSSNKKFLNAI